MLMTTLPSRRRPLLIKVPPPTIKVLLPAIRGAAVDRQGAAAGHQGVIVGNQGAVADRQGVIASRQGAAEQQRRGHRLPSRDVLIMEAIKPDVWIFTSAPRWTSTVVVCDNDLE
jgi:hypothetical protein